MQNELVTDMPAILLRRLDDLADHLSSAALKRKPHRGSLNSRPVVSLSRR